MRDTECAGHGICGTRNVRDTECAGSVLKTLVFLLVVC